MRRKQLIGTNAEMRPYLTECIYQLVLASQLSHKIVNLFIELAIVNNKLTILWGSWHSTTIELMNSARWDLEDSVAEVVFDRAADLTQCVHQMVLVSQLPHKSVNLFFVLVIAKDKLTNFWGSWLLQNDLKNTLSEMRPGGQRCGGHLWQSNQF